MIFLRPGELIFSIYKSYGITSYTLSSKYFTVSYDSLKMALKKGV